MLEMLKTKMKEDMMLKNDENDREEEGKEEEEGFWILALMM